MDRNMACSTRGVKRLRASWRYLTVSFGTCLVVPVCADDPCIAAAAGQGH